MITSYSARYRFLMFSLASLLSFTASVAQSRLILNGAKINLNQGVYLVIDNSAADAITRTGSGGHIISESENNRIKWNIGTTTGTYLIPWGYGNTDYIPLTFTKTAGTGSGYFEFSTYHTAWNNISQLPTGVTNINCACGTDNSAFVSDRFWQMSAQGYTVKPALSNVDFTYLDSENAGPNTITESKLRVKRYNSSLNSWTDNLLSNTLNTTTNTLTVGAVDNANLYSWWMLSNLTSNRYWVAPSNSNSNVSTNWAESPGGSGNAGVPTIDDAIIFDGTSDFNCLLNSDLSVASLTVNPGFLGNITQGSNAISVSNDATFSGGTFTGGSGAISVDGNFNVSGTSFTAPTASLDIKGNFNVTSGSFLHNNGTVGFTGTNGTTQTLSSATPLTFNNISVTNSAASPGVRVQSNQNMAGILTLANNVNFDADGSSNTSVFKLISTGDSPTQDAAVAALPSGAQVSGNVTVQRFMTKEGPNSGRIYRYISSPIQNATVADLQQEIPVTGTFTGKSTCTGCSSGSGQSLFAYNEAVLTDTDGNGVANQHDGYIDFPDISNTETFQAGRGYSVYVRANILTSTLWDLRGPINSGNVTPISFPVVYTSSGTLANDGWNLVGNPFPSTVDWNAASGWTKTNLETSIYITDNGSAASRRTASWNGVIGTNGGSRYISTGQGFWVKANGGGAPVLQSNENIKVAGTQTTFFREAQPSNLLRITLAQGAAKDETIIHFREDATAEFDGHADARKLPNSIVNISSILPGGQNLAINSQASFNCNTIIPLTINDVTAGSYNMTFSEYETFPEALTIILSDKLLNTTHNIRSGSYNFSVTSAAASYGAGRFTVSFSSPQLNPELNLSVSDVCEGGNAIVRIENAQPGIAYEAVFNSTSIAALNQDGIMTITIPQNNLLVGENPVIVKSSSPYCSTSLDKEVIVNVQPLLIPVVDSVMRCNAGSVTFTASGAPENGSYNWYEDQTSVVALDGQHTASFETPSLKKSKTYYVSIANSLGCEGERIAVEATIINLQQATINADSKTLTSSYQQGNQWYFNGEKIEGATAQTLGVSQSGSYKTEIVMQGCITSAEVEYNVLAEEVVVVSPPGEEGLPTTEIEKVSFYDIISISPNPFRETARLAISDSFKNVTQVRVINSVGQVIGFVELTQEDGKKTGTIQLVDYPSGIYLIQIFSATGVHERKIIKQ